MQNEIVKVENNNVALIASDVDRRAMQSLLPEEKKMIEAGLQPKVNEQPAEDVVTTFVAIITTAYTRAGFKMPDEATLFLYADEFYQSLLEKFPRVTIPEVREALKEGVYGAAGDFTGLNPKTFIQFIRHYLQTDARKAAVQIFSSRRDYIKITQGLNKEATEEFNKQYTNEQFELYLQGKLIVDFVPVDVYEFLFNNGHMPLSKEQKKQIKDRAKSYFTRLKASQKTKGNLRSVGDVLNDYMNTAEAEPIIINYSKRIAVLDFFALKQKEGATEIFHLPKLLPNE